MASEERRSLVRLEEVAQYLGVHPSTVKKKTARLEIQSVKIGRATRYRWDDIDNYLKRNTRGGGDGQR